MLCAVQRHQPLNTSISLDSAPFDSPPFFVLSPKINVALKLHPGADISIREVNSGPNTRFQNEFEQFFNQIRDDSAAGRLSHVPKDKSFNGLDPIKPRPKYKKAVYGKQRVIILEHKKEDAKKLHVHYGSEHALEPVGIEKDQRSRDSVFSSNSKKLASTAKSNPNSSTLSSKELHKLTFSSPVSTSNTGPKKRSYEGPPSTPSYRPSLQPEKVAKITTLNSPLYNPGSVDSPRSTPTESLSTTSSPVLEQAHPVLFPDSFSQVNQGERRSSVISIDSTVAPSSPQQTSKKRRRVHPSQGDSVLISFLGPDQPLVAIRAGESPLPWPSGSESTETEMEGGSGGNDGGGGNSNHGSRSVSRQHSSEGLRGNQNGGSSDGNATNGGAAAGGDGGDERKGNSGGGEKDKGNEDGEKDGEEKDKKEKDNKKKTDKDKETLTLETDAMDIDESSEDKPTNGEQKSKSEQEDVAKDGTGKRDSNAMEVEVSSGAAVSSLMALAAGAVGKDQQPHSSGATLPGSFSTAGATPWAHAQTSPGGTDRGPPPSPGPSNQLFQNNKLPLPNSPPSLPSMIPSMNAQSASSPNSLPSGNDGRHTTLPPVSSIHVLADIAEKESSHQQQSTRGYPNRMPPNSRTVYPTVSSHVSVAPSNRSAQAAQSPGLPPPGSAAHGFGPDGNPRPPMHHMTMQQRQYYMNQESSPTPYYPQHQHYQSYSQMKEGPQGSPNGNSGPYPPAFSQGRELPSILSSSPSAAANFFAQPHMPSTISGRRDSTMDTYYGSDQTPPSGPSTGETMPSSGTDDTVTSPRSRPGMPAGGQGGPLTAGVFKCEYPGCKAQPFQTQYLLNSHANVHSSARPHYCPVKNCARGEGGKGFKRKNEMIRHGLVHDSPGYVCPFCPDREHKYPRPDNLQRHVRVHHMDKDKDDPQLRDVLSQRPEGGNRGRRRRLGT